MTAFSRRSFFSSLARSFPAAILLSNTHAAGIFTPDEKPAIPKTIAGHELSDEEKTLMAKFCASQEKSLAPLRDRDLPNSLPPTFVIPTLTDGVRGPKK